PTDLARRIANHDGPAQTVHDTGPPQDVSRWFEASFSRQFIAHASIGTVCAVAIWENGSLTVWSHSQGVFALRSALATTLSLTENEVAVVHMPGAGCYGH